MSKKKSYKYQVYSPDGFPIIRDKTFKSIQDAQKALSEWVKRYEFQGYYSTSDRTRLTLDELPNHCKIKEL